MSRIVIRIVVRCALVVVLLGAASRSADADITSQGQLSLSLPAGGGNVGALTIGNDAVGRATINGGVALTGTTATLGGQATGIGEMTIADVGSLWDLSGALTVGNAGAGRVTVLNGGRLENAAATLAAGATGSADVLIDGFGSTWASSSTTVIANDGQALLSITNGGRVFSTSSVIGDDDSGQGAVALSGSQSLWRNSSTLTIADDGTGRLEVNSGARVENSSGIVADGVDAVGEVVVAGAGSTWANSNNLTIGNDGIASLVVADGGRVINESTGDVNLASSASAEARVEVRGAGSIWSSAGDIIVANAGVARVDVLDGGRIESGDVIVGALLDSYGKVVVDGAGSVWEIDGQLDIGNTAAGSNVGYGEVVVSNEGEIKASANSTSVFGVGVRGTLTLDGGRVVASNSASKLTSAGVIQGSGVIDCPVTSTANAEIRTTYGELLSITADLATAGLVDLYGGTLQVSDAIVNTGAIAIQDAAIRVTRLDAATNALQNNAGGRIAITGGIADVYASVTNAAGAELVVGGGSKAVFHDAVVNNGELFVMPGSRALMLEDLAFGVSSVTTLVLTGAVDDAAGPRIEVGGTVALAGSLAVLVDSGYVPTAGDAFEVLTAAGGRSGTFDSATLPTLDAGLSWLVDYQPQSLVLRVTASQPADFNGDGSVDGLDLAAWDASYGTGPGASQAEGDATGDGFVDGADYLAWQRSFWAAANPAGAAIPEPSTLAAAALFVTGLAVRHRR